MPQQEVTFGNKEEEEEDSSNQKLSEMVLGPCCHANLSNVTKLLLMMSNLM